MIEIDGLCKRYGSVEALRGVSTSIARGEIVGLLGPNGAGKTTTMKILVGFLLPSSGSAHVAGFNVVEKPLEVQKRIGYLPENAPLYSDMLVHDYLRFMGEMRELDRETLRRRIACVADDCSIVGVLRRPISHLSKGYRQRVGLAGALLHDPDLLILDEPTTGLDPNQIVEIRELIRRMGSTKTIILSTHILPEVEASCDRAVILIDGTIRADGKLKELTRTRTQSVVLQSNDPDGTRSALAALSGVESVACETLEDGFRRYRLALDGDAGPGEAIYDLARRHDWRLRELSRDDKTLEDLFRELTMAQEELPA
jgi:ABC-2 type transport system ATP-binding protein